MLSHLAARRWFGVALFHGEAVGVERPPAGAGDPSGTEAEPSADVRSLQAYLRAGREPAIELQVAFGMQLACGDARYVAAAWASFRLIGWSTEQPSSSSGHASLAASRSSTLVIRAPASLTARTGPVPG